MSNEEVGPAVLNTSVAVPAPFATVAADGSEQVAEGVLGEIVQVRFTVETPPTALIVTSAVAVAPGAMLLDVDHFAVRLKFGAVGAAITCWSALDVLLVIFEFPA